MGSKRQYQYMKSNFGTQNEANRIAWLGNILKQIPTGSRILDAGAGELKYKKFCSHLKYVSQDFGRYNGRGDGKGLQTGAWDQNKLDIISDITAIPEPDASFDAIMCIEVLEHLPNPVLALKEFSRLLRTGGSLIITAPFCSLTHFAPYHYSTGFNSYFYQKHLKEFGLEILEISPNGNFFEYLAQEIRRIPEIAGKYCSHQMSLTEKINSWIMLKMLERFSKKDEKSSELLCFGYHIHAQKT